MLWKVEGWWLWVLLVLAVGPLVVAQKIGDPYQILGVHKKATLQEIRKAYRQLAKEWHPDKNEDPKAESRFVEIKQAYELLTDTERRQAYDLHGITNEDEYIYKDRHDYSKYARYSNDPFEEFFGTHFRTQDQDITLFHKLSVTARHFENNIVEKSVHTPALVLFYTDWCFECVRSAAAWRRLVEALQPLGVTLATVHAGHEYGLAKRVGVSGVPCLTMVLDKHVYIYKDALNSLPKILEFMRWRFPYKMVTDISNSNIDWFVNDFEDNRVKALIFEERHTIRLRYLITAFHYRSRLSFGFVDMTADTQNISSRFKVQRGMDTMVLLKEDSQEPAATVSTTEIPTQTLRELIEANQMLTLPRLSSQSVLDALCPVEWRALRRQLCCVFLTGSRVGGTAGAAGGGGRERGAAQLRALARSAPPRARFAYLYTHRQPAFVHALANGSGIDFAEVEHRIVIFWRREASRIQYEWFNHTWPTCTHPSCDKEGESEEVLKFQERLNETKRALERMIKRLLKPNEVMAYEANIQELTDEGDRGAILKAVLWVCEWTERLVHLLRRQHAISALSVLLTVGLVLAAGYFMAYLIRVEEEAVQRQKDERRKQNGTTTTTTGKRNNNDPPPELRLHELRTEKYNGLVRLLKPGCRTIVLLVDMQSRVMLLSKFHKIVWPYRKNKTLLFAYLMVERNIEWFRRVLQLSLGGAGGTGGPAGGGELRVNARNCVGTVLALNPHRKYFCIYHAKHPESAKPHKRMSRMTRSLGGGGRRGAGADPEAGAFIGFTTDPDCSSGDEAPPAINEPLLQENLLDGLENWLDRLFEGSTHRYYINYWPDMTSK